MDGYLTKPVPAAHPHPQGVLAERAPASFDAEAFLARLDGDRELRAELVELMKQQIPVALTEMRRCVDSGDGPGLQRVAHTLRGSVLQFDASDAAEAALALETCAREGGVPDAGLPVRALEQELERLLRDLSRLEEVGAP